MSTEVTRHFATINARQVHYRRAGAGPPVLLLHQTPASSAELLPLMRHLAPRFTVIAPDMPGYGSSDRLGSSRVVESGKADAPAPLTIDALADDLTSLMSTLAIDTAGVYGFHTGASIAIALARRHPARVAVAIADGVLCLDTHERDEWLRRYLEPFTARWDGSHLAWLWTRLKDQSVYFPWYERNARGRLAIDAAGLAALGAKAQDWLQSGEHYHAAYRAAMTYDPSADIGRTQAPCYILAQPGDPLTGQLQRLPVLPHNVRVEALAGGANMMARVDEIFATHCTALRTPKLTAAAPIEGGIWQEYIGTQGAQLRVLRAGGGDAPALLVQHDAQSSAALCAPLLAGFAHRRAVYAVDLPGHGLSDLLPSQPAPTFEQLAELLRAAIAAYGVRVCDHIGIGAGAALAVELERAMQGHRQAGSAGPAAGHSLTLVAPIDVSAQAALRDKLAASYDHAPLDSHGGYLLKAWHEVRDHQLFFPWFERGRAHGAPGATMLAAQELQELTVAHILSGASGVAMRRREAHYPLLERLRGCNAATFIAACESSPRAKHARALVEPDAQFVPLEQSMATWHRTLGAVLASNRSGGHIDGGAPRAVS